jgi:hypothetical protein
MNKQQPGSHAHSYQLLPRRRPPRHASECPIRAAGPSWCARRCRGHADSRWLTRPGGIPGTIGATPPLSPSMSTTVGAQRWPKCESRAGPRLAGQRVGGVRRGFRGREPRVW